MDELLTLALEHAVDGNAGPARDHLGDLVGGDLLLQELAARLGGLRQLPLQIGNDRIAQLAGAREIATALHDLELAAGLVELLLQALHGGQLLLLGAPLGSEIGRLAIQLGDLLLDLLEPILGGGVRFLLQRLALDLELDDAPVELVELLGLGLRLDAQAAGRLVNQVDGLVGQEAIGDVAVGESGRGDDGAVGDAHAMVDLVLLLEPAQDGDGLLHRGLADEHRLEAPGQRRILLDVLAIFIEGGGADTVQLAARQRGLEHVGGIHGAFSLAGADESVQLVDEQHDVARSPNLLEHGLQPLLELATILGPGEQEPEIER